MDNIDRKLMQHWRTLRRESGGEFYDIVRLFDEAVTRLPEEPSRYDFEGMIDLIGDPLRHYPSGRHLLDVVVAVVDDDIGVGGETPAQKRNRFRTLPDSEKEAVAEEESEGDERTEEDNSQIAEA
jgi:hypothetical protein